MERGESMNIIIFSLTILSMYGILRYAYKAYQRADIKETMENIKETEENYNNVVEFIKTHKGSIKQKNKTIDKFTTKE